MKKGINSLKITAALAMLAAISIICGKYLAIPGGEVMRFSLESMPIILSGMAFGPVAGIAVGTVADLVGCFMVGYTVNPLVTLGAASIGAISGILPFITKKISAKPIFTTALTTAAAHLVGSVIIKTIGLSAYYDMPFAVLVLWRLLNYLIVGTLDGLIVHALMSHKGIRSQLSKLKGDAK